MKTCGPLDPHDLFLALRRYSCRLRAIHQTRQQIRRWRVRWKGDDGGVWLSLARWFNPAGIANPEHRPEVNLSLFKPNSGAASE